jgi:hypothetical protein
LFAEPGGSGSLLVEDVERPQADVGDFFFVENTVTAVRHGSAVHHEKVDVAKAIGEHIRLMIDVMDAISQKAIKTIFKGDDKTQKEFSGELANLRIEKAGGLVFKGPKGSCRL